MNIEQKKSIDLRERIEKILATGKADCNDCKGIIDDAYQLVESRKVKIPFI